MELLEDLKKRKLIYQFTPGIEEFFKKKGILYFGIDPTAESLHLGHYLSISFLKRFYLNGHKIIIVLGGGTSKIGDPSGKIKERPILPLKVLNKNKKNLKKQIKKFFPLNEKKIKLIDNSQWLDNLKLAEFLREIGKIVSINSMLDLEAVRQRLEHYEFMSFSEFTYQLLQAYDFFILFKKYNCELQVGGSDQWGNIVQGVELIRKKLGKKAYGLVYPLLVDPKTGKKFGKTEEGETLWLDYKKTHPFRIYQFLFNLDDETAKDLLLKFSFKPLRQLEKIIEEGNKKIEERIIQKSLAQELILNIYGKKILDEIIKINKILFEKNFEKISLEEIKKLKHAIFTIKLKDKLSLEEVLVKLNLAKSKSEARNLMSNVKILEKGKFLLIKKGKKDFGLVEYK